jgi:threonine aldolase
MSIIDLRSDTLTRPTEEMLTAMREASQGDDSRDGDPAVQKLEALAANRTGKQAAAFMPSGTMTNLVALLTHAQRGGEVLLDQRAHILNSEMGGITSIAGLMYRGLPGHRGAVSLEMLADAIKPETSRNRMGTALICMETSHNGAGGAVLPLTHMQTVFDLAQRQGIPVHIDGARLFNAATALNVEASKIAQYSDSVCFCVSKGLSAPVGSVLCGSETFIERARAFRRMVGGNMRQAGAIAAAGIVALETMVDRLMQDHATARQLAAGLHKLSPKLINPLEVETNIVRVDVSVSGKTAAQWSADLQRNGVAVGPCAKHALRFVTHRHIGSPEIEKTLHVFSNLWSTLEAA